ncbi:MAG: hypothetical protein U0990_09730 [Candidatus Nanopelagicales bacterium]|nr:hypothetical protein [Candidatus Nanopelagicales bacterium]
MTREETLERALRSIRALVDILDVDYEADAKSPPPDVSSAAYAAHVAGLIYQEATAALGDGG